LEHLWYKGHRSDKRTSWSHSEKQKIKKKKNKDRQLLVASLIVIDFTIWFRVGLFVGNIFFS